MADNEKTQQIRDKAKELLEAGSVQLVIGYERGTDGLNARPAFIYEPQEAGRLVFDNTCTHNLVRYLRDREEKAIAVVAKPCDSRALNLLLNERQLERERVFVIGVVCEGVMQGGWCQTSENLQSRCEICPQHTPVLYDLLVGEPVEEKTSPERYPDVAQWEGKSEEEREAFWREQFSRCIRCYACRQACPGCYCTECFADQLDPEWLSIRIDLPEKRTWNIIRAFHLAGRCIACNECERVCPVNLPLSLLNRRLEKEVQELFGFQSGMIPEVPPPLGTFVKDEHLGVGE